MRHHAATRMLGVVRRPRPAVPFDGASGMTTFCLSIDELRLLRFSLVDFIKFAFKSSV